jgi:uncharacterized protein (TIGR02996 family)
MTVAPTTAVPPLPAPYLRQILAHPDDDGPRLVAADWWDERGAAERAEFVRVQCELARLGPKLDCLRDAGRRHIKTQTRVIILRRRERELLDSTRKGWCWSSEIPAGWFLAASDRYAVGPHLGLPSALACRGFVEALTCPAADFLVHADALTAACPLKRVRLTTWPEVELTRINARDGFRLVGRRYVIHPTAVRSGESHDSLGLRLLKAEFKGIKFEMPTVELQPSSLLPFQLPLTTDDRLRSP